MLHDAWSAKMHDLTYKPIGMLDPRLTALMTSIADAIESVEQQSRLIRDMITAGWNVESATRRAIRQAVFEVMLNYRAEVNDPELQAVHEKIEASSDVIASKALDHPLLVELVDATGRCCRDPAKLRHGWLMAGRIASLRPSGDLTRFFARHADAWLTAAPQLLAAAAISEREISAVPLMFYVIGDLDRAIDYATEIVNGRVPGVSEDRKARIDFNRVTFLAEREYHFPTSDQVGRERLRADIEAVLKSERVRALENIAADLRDTEGFVKITFAQTKDDVRLGIESRPVASRARKTKRLRTRMPT